MKDREIVIRCDFAREVCHLFGNFISQLSYGYWENSRGEWGDYGDGYYEDIWNCFDVTLKASDGTCHSRYDFVIVLRGKPINKEAKNDHEWFHNQEDLTIVNYIKDALFDAVKEAPIQIFRVDDYELDILMECINSWGILPPPKPKLSHKELEELVGYEFDYIK